MLAHLITLALMATSPLPFETEPADTVLVRLHDVIPDLMTDVRYATVENFTGQVLYPSDTLRARRFAVEGLQKAQEEARRRGLQLE